jgi:hypothetical protein
MRSACFRPTLALCLGTFVVSGSASAASDKTWFLWNVYKAHFMAADGRIVDWNSEGRTTSEGQAYALFFALVADDRASFDLVLKWSQDNLAKGSLQENLPSWLWKRTAAGEWGSCRRKLSIRCRSLDGLHADSGRAIVAGALLFSVGPGDDATHRRGRSGRTSRKRTFASSRR